MFHVKQFGVVSAHRWKSENRRVGLRLHDNARPNETALLPNTEIAENNVQDIFYVDPAGQAPQRTSRKPQILCKKARYRWRNRTEIALLR